MKKGKDAIMASFFNTGFSGYQGMGVWGYGGMGVTLA